MHPFVLAHRDGICILGNSLAKHLPQATSTPGLVPISGIGICLDSKNKARSQAFLTEPPGKVKPHTLSKTQSSLDQIHFSQFIFACSYCHPLVEEASRRKNKQTKKPNKQNQARPRKGKLSHVPPPVAMHRDTIRVPQSPPSLLSVTVHGRGALTTR